jgi:hypothetical protein
MAVLYWTDITPCSAIADTFAQASHARLTRMRQGTWSGHTLLALALCALCTVADGYLIVEDTVVEHPDARRFGKPRGCGRASSARSCSGSPSCSSSGRTGRSGCRAPFACGPKAARRNTPGPESGGARPTTGSSASCSLSSLTRGIRRRSGASAFGIPGGTSFANCRKTARSKGEPCTPTFGNRIGMREGICREGSKSVW